MIDLSIFDLETRAEGGFTVAIHHPSTYKPVGIEIDVYGIDSKTAAAAQKRMASAIADGADKESAQMVFLAECTKGWRGIADAGKEVVFSADKAAEIYRKYKAIREQVDLAIAQRSRLFTNEKDA
jgi:hypothetical protein